VFLGVIVAATVWMMLAVFRDRQELLNERFKGVIQRGQPRTDRLVMLLFWIAYLTLLVFIPYDVFQLHVFEKPGLLTLSLGMGLILAGYWIVALAFRENTFAVPVIKHQKERQHVVVDTGPYAIVRHPLYAGVMLLFIGMPLWLESYAGVLVAAFPIATFMLLAPARQMGRIQPFPTKQFSQLARRDAPLRLGQNPQFVARLEPSTPGLLRHFRAERTIALRVIRHPVPPRPLQ